MPWPQTTEYHEAIQNLRTSVSDEELRQGEPALNARGLPMPYSGNFADVYKVHCPATGNTWAVKCFTRESPERRDRYRQIAAHLRRANLAFTVDFQFIEPGIRAAGQWYPFLKMRWVEGRTLNHFVENHLDQRQTLRQLLLLWMKLAHRLRKVTVAHADLQHGNVLLVPGRELGRLELKLIDYDGMYVPALAGHRSGELGHPAYQHPQRLRDRIYSLEVDRFSHLAIFCAIRCLIGGGRSLWQRFDNADNMLFREEDFRNPRKSEAFQELWAASDAEARRLVGRLVLATQTPLDQVPLLEEIVQQGHVAPLSASEEKAVGSLLNGGRARRPPPAARRVRGHWPPSGGLAEGRALPGLAPPPLAAHCRGFWHGKRGGSPEQSSSVVAADPTVGRFAVVQGRGEDVHAVVWAQLLAQQFVQAANIPIERLGDWLPPVQEEWSLQIRNVQLPWSEDAPGGEDALAALVGVLVAADEGASHRWQAVAVGHTSLFHTRATALLDAFPQARVADFHGPGQAIGPLVPAGQVAPRFKQGLALPGDRLWMMTSALGQWFLAQCEAGNRPWEELEWLVEPGASQPRFAAWVERLRGAGLPRNEDVAVAIIAW